jgi:preprotein translocase subunit SecG
MIVSPLLAVALIMKIIAVVFVFCSIALILIILVQKGRGGGLSGALGGGMASNILGSKTGDFLTWVTIVTVALFLSLAIIMAKFYKPTVSDYSADQPIGTDQPIDAEQPPDIDDSEAPIGDISNNTDTNLPDS